MVVGDFFHRYAKTQGFRCPRPEGIGQERTFNPFTINLDSINEQGRSLPIAQAFNGAVNKGRGLVFVLVHFSDVNEVSGRFHRADVLTQGVIRASPRNFLDFVLVNDLVVERISDLFFHDLSDGSDEGFWCGRWLNRWWGEWSKFLSGRRSRCRRFNRRCRRCHGWRELFGWQRWRKLFGSNRWWKLLDRHGWWQRLSWWCWSLGCWSLGCRSWRNGRRCWCWWRSGNPCHHLSHCVKCSL